MTNVMSTIEPLVELRDRTLGEFLRAIRLIESMDLGIFLHASSTRGNVGSHFRHNLDFANNFLHGLETGTIDYANRDRDIRVEQDPKHAVRQIRTVVIRLQDLTPKILKTDIVVISELDEKFCHVSSASRELEFLHSHTVHHHALVAEKLKFLGVEVAQDFGVAPSTIRFWLENSII